MILRSSAAISVCLDRNQPIEFGNSYFMCTVLSACEFPFIAIYWADWAGSLKISTAISVWFHNNKLIESLSIFTFF